MSDGGSSQRSVELHGWRPLILLAAAVLYLAFAPSELRDAFPAGVWAWGLVFAFFGAMKWLTWRRAPTSSASSRLQLGYLFAWPGLDAPTFFTSDAARREPVDPRAGVQALGKMLLGAALFWGVARFVPDDLPIVRGWVGLAALAIGVLGGLFHFLSWLWRAGGVDAQPIMNRPLRARNLADFWGRRWNLAFHDFAAQFLQLPLAKRFGRPTAIVGVFLFSGLLHDAVLSLPAEAGYGRPTAYFLFQLVGLAVEQSRLVARFVRRRPLAGRLLAAVFLLVPAGLLFHRPFIERVWLPFMAAAGAL